MVQPQIISSCEVVGREEREVAYWLVCVVSVLAVMVSEAVLDILPAVAFLRAILCSTT